MGERLYGFFPMANHLFMKAGERFERGFTDAVPHRGGLLGIYNYYARTQSEPAQLQALEDHRCIFPRCL